MKLTLFKQPFSLPALLSITAEAEEKRNALAIAAGKVKSVTTPDAQAIASAAAVNIQAHIKQVRETGLDFRRPANDFVALIKRTEDDYLKPLLEEKDRLGKLLADFAESEVRRVQEEEKKRQEELQRAEDARIEAERRAAIAAFEAEESGAKKDVKAAEKLQKQADKAEAKVQAVIAAPAPERSKAAGVSTRRVLCWEVTDINALVKARPELCNITAKPSAIQALCIPETPVPGLRLWWQNKAVVRGF